MKTTALVITTLGLATAAAWGAVTQYNEPLPAGMAANRVFLDGYVAASFPGTNGEALAWSANTNAYGHTVQNINMNQEWLNAGPWVNNSALQWSNVNFSSTGTQDVWLSWIYIADTAGKTLTYTVSAGPDAGNLTTRGTYNLTTAAYDTGMYWTKIGSGLTFNATDTVVRLTLNTSYDYLFYVQGVDELVFATSAPVPEPASLALLALGGLALLRRRR